MSQRIEEEQPKQSPYSSRQLMVYVAVGASFLSLVITFGDIIDIFGYIVLWGGLLGVLWPLSSRPKRKVLAWSILCFISHVVFFVSLNRVHGYPSKEYMPFLQYLIMMALWMIVIIFFIACYRQWRVALMCVGILLLPVIEGPIFLMRQLIARIVMVEKGAEVQEEALYTSRLGWQYGIRVGRYTNTEKKTVLIAMVYTRIGFQYHHQKSIWLLDGQGSMEEQRPNLPILLEYLILRDS